MAYLTFTSNGEEFDRRELHGVTVIGRAQDCDISVHDIMLSRHHCRIERAADESGAAEWRIVDLHSKNGTYLRGHKIEKHTLRDGEQLRIGRTRLTFRAGAFVPGTRVRQRAVVRARDPHEALAGTVSGMVVCEPGESGVFPGLPVPKPRPADPSSYVREDVYGMINEIVSSSWDSVMAENSQPVRRQRAMPVAAATRANRGALAPKPRVSFALQADDGAAREELVGLKAKPRAAHKRRWVYAVATVTLFAGVFASWYIAKVTPATAASALPSLEIPQTSGSTIDDADAVPASDISDEIDLSLECTDIDY